MFKVVCVEVGMIVLRFGKNKIGYEYYVDVIVEVQVKKKDVSINVFYVYEFCKLINFCRLLIFMFK